MGGYGGSVSESVVVDCGVWRMFLCALAGLRLNAGACLGIAMRASGLKNHEGKKAGWGHSSAETTSQNEPLIGNL